MAVFVAMNQFQVNPERASEFEEQWRKRETYLEQVPGFRGFLLLRGDEPGVYISHSTWESRAAFEAWTRSEAFRKAHAQARTQGRTPEGVLQGPPRLRLFETVIEQPARGS